MGRKKNQFKDYEKNLVKKGYKVICGVDEVGRGSWAGPITACAVVIKDFSNTILDDLGIYDSKNVTKKRREKIFKIVTDKDLSSVEYNIFSFPAEKIDKIGLGYANQLVLRKAVEGLEIKPDYILADGFLIKDLNINQTAVIDGDKKVFSIAIASIIAKVSRDDYMIKIAEEYKNYKFEKHKGYGTKLHQEMLKKYGVCPEHRKSFKPIKKYLRY